MMRSVVASMFEGRFSKESLPDRRLLRDELRSAVRDLSEKIDQTPKLRWIKRMKMRARMGGLLHASYSCLDPMEVWAESLEQEIAHRSPIEAMLGIIETKESKEE